MNNREKFEARFQFGDLAYYNSVTNCYRSNGSHNRDLAREIQCKWEGYQAALTESAARIAELEQKLAEAEGMGECTLMLRDDLIQAGIIKDTVPPMFLTEAILGHIQAITNTGDKTT